MNQEFGGDVRFFLATVLLGAAAAMVYDVLRVWRRFHKQTLFVVSLQDFLFWFVLGIFGFRLLYRYNAGTIRMFALGGMCLGACVYVWTIGRFFVTCCLKLLLFLTFPLRKGLNFLRKQGKLLSKKLPKREKHGRKDAHAAKERKEKNGT
ncbi:MAG: spore cortex biosynthesis protein YabQ [Lachnospiraceae bacterium]|nr:spore cortex biosynthesis protein YabQ [Lachnospiraceae bacterium]